MGDESKGPRAVAVYPEKQPSYFPNADNRSWIVGRVCFQPSLTWLHICRTCVIFTMSWVSSGLGLSDTTFIVMPLPLPCDSVLVILRFSWFMTALYLLFLFLFFLILWFFEGSLLQLIVTSIFLLEFAAKVLAPWAHSLKPAYPYAAWPSDWSPVGLPSGLSGWVGFPFVQVPVHGWRRYRSLHWVSSVSVQVYCELLARVPVTTTLAPLFEYLTPRGKAL